MQRAISWSEVSRRTGGLLLFWLVFLFFVLNQQYAGLRAQNAWRSFVDDGVPLLLWFLPWMPLSAILLLAAVRLPLLDYRPVRNFLLLLAVVVVVVNLRFLVHGVLQATGFTSSPATPLSWSAFQRNLATGGMRELLSTLFIMACFTLQQTYRAAAERGRSSALLQARLAEAELRYLRVQMQPHFLFNALNAVTTLIAKDPPAAEKTIGHLSELLRRALEEGELQVVSVARELEFLERYIAIQHVRYGERLQTRIDIEPELRDARIPSMILQPLVENAIRHSIARREGGAIAVTMHRGRETIVIRVTDDGQGIDDEHTAAGIGIANIRSRLEHLYDDRAAVRIVNRPGAFTVEIVLPIEQP